MSAIQMFDAILVSTTTTGTGAKTLGSPITGFFDATVIPDGTPVYYDIYAVDGSGTPTGDREIGLAVISSTGTVLTTSAVIRSTNSNAAVSFAAGTKYITISVIPSVAAQRSLVAALGAIRGLEQVYSSTTALIINAGSLAINGKWLTLAQTTYTSASTMKDLNNATVTLGASKCYHLYAYDNSGTLEIRVQDWSDGTWGGNPTFDSDLDYWKSPSAAGAAARRIGKFWTNASNQIMYFWMTHVDRRFRKVNGVRNYVTLVNAGNATSYTAVTITPYITGDDAEFMVQLSGVNSASPAQAFLSVDGGTMDVAFVQNVTASANNFVPGQFTIPNTGSLKYKANASGTVTVALSGVGLNV